MLFFYREASLCTWMGDRSTSLLGHANYPLALIQANRASELMAVDNQHSPLNDFENTPSANLSFSAYGTKNHHASSTVGFKGHYADPASHLYLLGNGHRPYSPHLMRFTRPDSLSPFDAGGLNCYAFCLGDPVNGSDPTGKSPQFNWRKFLYSPISRETYKGTIRMEHDGIVVFSSNTERSTLFISPPHGIPESLIGKSGLAYSPKVIFDGLNKKGITTIGRETHILSCYSAIRGENNTPSFIEGMARLTGAPSSGYPSRVSVGEHKSGSKFTAYKLFNDIFPDSGSEPITVDRKKRPIVRSPRR